MKRLDSSPCLRRGGHRSDLRSDLAREGSQEVGEDLLILDYPLLELGV